MNPTCPPAPRCAPEFTDSSIPEVLSLRPAPFPRACAATASLRRKISPSTTPACSPGRGPEGRQSILADAGCRGHEHRQQLLHVHGDGMFIGPILIGAVYSVPVAARTIAMRGISNMTALAVARVDAAGGMEVQAGDSNRHSRTAPGRKPNASNRAGDSFLITDAPVSWVFEPNISSHGDRIVHLRTCMHVRDPLRRRFGARSRRAPLPRTAVGAGRYTAQAQA